MQLQSPALKELSLHGTESFPCAIYQTRSLRKGTLVKHHWHDEVEILHFFGGEKVLTYIKENYKEKIYIQDLANQIHMNEQYFCRFFKKSIGRSPMEYINEYRIKQAMRLLEKTDLPVTEVCLESGYNNLGNFLRAFKKYTETTPLKYRNRFHLRIGTKG